MNERDIYESIMSLFLPKEAERLRKRKGLSFYRRRKRIQASAVQEILLWAGECILAVAIGGNSLGGGKFSLAGSVIGAFTIQALTTTLSAMHVSSDQVPVYKAIVVVIIVALQSPGFARWRKSLLQKKEMAAGKEAA